MTNLAHGNRLTTVWNCTKPHPLNFPVSSNSSQRTDFTASSPPANSRNACKHMASTDAVIMPATTTSILAEAQRGGRDLFCHVKGEISHKTNLQSAFHSEQWGHKHTTTNFRSLSLLTTSCTTPPCHRADARSTTVATYTWVLFAPTPQSPVPDPTPDSPPSRATSSGHRSRTRA